MADTSVKIGAEVERGNRMIIKFPNGEEHDVLDLMQRVENMEKALANAEYMLAKIESLERRIEDLE